jgi:glycosyltransferase involved in cell wall biosynthesis
VSAAQAVLPDVLVVDDGSGPETQAILEGLEGITLLRHETNRGKGAALQTGLEEAHRLGFTHAVSMDSDGQHLASEIPKFLAEAEQHPEAIILGDRDLVQAGAGPGSRIGRANSNFWTWVLTGIRLPDTQTGFRCYPLEPLSPLAFHCNRYDFEIEVLVRAAWSEVPIRSIPIAVRYYPKGAVERVSHLRLFEYARIAYLNTKLCFQKFCLPLPYLRLRCTRRYHEQGFVQRWRDTFLKSFVEEQGPPGRIAAAVALGLFWALAPVWGFQILLTLFFANLLGLSRPIALVATNISLPPVIPPILYGSLVLGRWALSLPEEVARITDLELAPDDAPAFVIGSLLLAVSVSLTGGVLTWLGVILGRALSGNTIPDEAEA